MMILSSSVAIRRPCHLHRERRSISSQWTRVLSCRRIPVPPIRPSSRAPFSAQQGGGDADRGSAESTSKGKSFSHYRLPPPTWSVSDLQLTVNHEPVSDEVLKELCRRACVTIPPLTSTRADGGDEGDGEATLGQMAQDVGNLLHMLRQVRSLDPNLVAAVLGAERDDNNDEERARLLYDAPRGLSPIVFDASDNDDDSSSTSRCSRSQQDDSAGDTAKALPLDADALEEEALEIDRVRDVYLRPKMEQVGGHSYFVVPTGRSRGADDDSSETSR